MGDLILLVIIGTSIWVFFDAKSIGVKKGQIAGFANMGPVGWMFGCLLLWIIGFPLYVAKRGEFKRINKTWPNSVKQSSMTMPNNIRQSSMTDIEQLEKLASLKERGLITEEEYNAKKKNLLGI